MIKLFADLLVSDRDTVTVTLSRQDGRLRLNILPHLSSPDGDADAPEQAAVRRALAKPLCVTGTLEELEGEKLAAALATYGTTRRGLYATVDELGTQMDNLKAESEQAALAMKQRREKQATKTPAKPTAKPTPKAAPKPAAKAPEPAQAEPKAPAPAGQAPWRRRPGQSTPPAAPESEPAASASAAPIEPATPPAAIKHESAGAAATPTLF